MKHAHVLLSEKNKRNYVEKFLNQLNIHDSARAKSKQINPNSGKYHFPMTIVLENSICLTTCFSVENLYMQSVEPPQTLPKAGTASLISLAFRHLLNLSLSFLALSLFISSLLYPATDSSLHFISHRNS